MKSDLAVQSFGKDFFFLTNNDKVSWPFSVTIFLKRAKVIGPYISLTYINTADSIGDEFSPPSSSQRVLTFAVPSWDQDVPTDPLSEAASCWTSWNLFVSLSEVHWTASDNCCR